MKKRDFIFWLKGYFASIDKTRPTETVIDELINEIEKLDINMSEKTLERIIEKEYPQNPMPHFPLGITSMYGVLTPDLSKDNHFNTQITNIDIE